jgi:hypothetical protein
MAQAKRESITRRGILSVLAVLPAAVALPAPDAPAAPPRLQPPPASSLPDPIFAAIDAHARALAGLESFADTLANAEQAAWHAPRGQRRAANKRLKEAYATERRLGDAVSDTEDRFAATVPATLSGAAAALAYVRAHYARGYPMCEEEESNTLLGSIETAIRRFV